MSNQVSRQHVKDMRHLLLRIRTYVFNAEKVKVEQLAIDHMGMTDKGTKYLEKHQDGVELAPDVAYKIVHRHFRDLTYAYLDGRAAAQDVLDSLDKQIRVYEAFITDYDPIIVPAVLDIAKTTEAYILLENMHPIGVGFDVPELQDFAGKRVEEAWPVHSDWIEKQDEQGNVVCWLRSYNNKGITVTFRIQPVPFIEPER